MGMGFGISEDDVIVAAGRRGLKLTDDEASKWFDELNHDAIECIALEADDMDEQTDLAISAIESQLDELGCFDAIKAQQTADTLSESTVPASGSRVKRM